MLSAIHDRNYILEFIIYFEVSSGDNLHGFHLLSCPFEKQCLLLFLEKWALLEPLLQIAFGLYTTHGDV